MGFFNFGVQFGRLFGPSKLKGSSGTDLLFGGFRDDMLIGGGGRDFLFGGLGRDTAVFSGGVEDYSIQTRLGWRTDITNANGDRTRAYSVERLNFEADDYTVDLTGRNNAVLVRDDARTTGADAPAVFSGLLDNDFDFDGDALTVTGIDTTNTIGTASLSDDGTIIYDAGDAFEWLSEGETAETAVEYTVTDGRGSRETATLNITIMGENDAPTLAVGAAEAVENGAAVSLDLAALGNDPDSDDDGTTLIYEITDAPVEGQAWIDGTVLSFDPDAGFADLEEGQTRDVIIQVTATDGFGETAVNDMTFTVTGKADADLRGIALAGAQGNPATVLLPKQAGGYDATELTGLTGGGGDVAAGDLNGDGFADLFQVRSYAPDRVYLNQGDGTFEATSQELGAFGAVRVELGDADGDGDLDAFVANNFGGARVWINDGTGQFTDQALAFGFRFRDVGLGDFDGDGDLDAVYAQTQGYPNGFPAGSGGLEILTNDGTGSFTQTSHDQSDLIDMVGVEVADFNGDGSLDIFGASENHPNAVDQRHLLLINDGSGAFSVVPQALQSTGMLDVTAADFDGDGDIDVGIVDGSDVLQLLMNDGDGMFQSASFQLSGNTSNITAGDVDGDGDINVLMHLRDDGVSIMSWESGTFVEDDKIPLDERSYGIEIADFSSAQGLDDFLT